MEGVVSLEALGFFFLKQTKVEHKEALQINLSLKCNSINTGYRIVQRLRENKETLLIISDF